MKKFLIPSILAAIWTLHGCGSDSEEMSPVQSSLQVSDFQLSIAENQSEGTRLGQIEASGEGILNFSMGSQTPSGALAVSSTGELSIADSCAFNFEKNAQITATVNVSDANANANSAISIDLSDQAETLTVWNGSTISFTKPQESDPTIEANQDRITDQVWITRGNEGGQIYNARVESSADADTSPVGTLWAIGTTEDVATLCFDTFRNTIRPRNSPGVNLVMYLITDDVYLDLTITDWPGGRVGGFTYTRSTEP